MTQTLYWLQCGGCGGDTFSLLNAEAPDLIELLKLSDIRVLWHPSLSNLSPGEQGDLIGQIVAGRQPLDFLCVEGAVLRGPSGTGMFDTFNGRPKKDLVHDLAHRARFVLAVGTCASFGGVPARSGVDGTGLQFSERIKGGFLGKAFLSGAGSPVINLPGCPCHCDPVIGTLAALSAGKTPELTELNSPSDWYGLLVHQGCPRNEYHEYRVEESDFGQKGCLFFHMGCRGPLVYGPCNKLLWNRRSSKTQAGVPCVGCCGPEFPQPHAFFKTRNIAGIPLELPDGVDRAHYLAYKGIAAEAAPERLLTRKTKI